MEIKKGMKFLCIKDVVMRDGRTAYLAGQIYISEIDGCITDEQKHKKQLWNDSVHVYFEKIDGESMACDKTDYPEPSVKNDFKDGKLRWDLLPLELVEELVKVYDYGAKKYYPESWKEIPDGYQRLKAASLRHLVAFEKGETNDSESGLNHLACSAWNMLTCMYYAKLKEKEE